MHRMLLFSLLAVFAPSGMAHAQDWIVYNPANSELPGSQIYSIAVDADGTIWIGTAGFGLVSYDGSTWSTYSTSNSELPGNYVNALAIDGDGNFAGSVSGGCVEGAVVETAIEVLENHRPKLVSFGISDEIHQSFVPGRSPDLWDLVADSLGALLGAYLAPLLVRYPWRGRREPHVE